MLKIAVISFGVLLLLPVLIFNAIPHFLFGWLGNDSADVGRMTDMAVNIGGIYNRFDDISRRETEKLIQELSEGYETDAVSVDVRNTNLAWLIAIIAVQYNQDLYTIDEDAIRNMIADKLTYSSSFYDGKQSLRIEDLDPYELMDKLEFGTEQRQWAEFLFSNMTDTQTVSDAEYINSSDKSYGGIIYSDGLTDVIYYSQADSRWGNELYGKTNTIGKAGCGPAALAMAVSSLTGKSVTPKDVADWSYANGYRVEHSGSKHSLIPDGARHYGLRAEGAGIKDAQKVIDALTDGKLVIAIMSAGHFTSGGHFILLRGVTADGMILVADPISVSRSEQPWEFQIILNEVNRNAGAGGPFWILSA